MGSNTNFSIKDIELLVYRENLFQEEIDQYVSAVTGERSSLLPYVRNEDGVYDEAKTWAFIDELTGYAHMYWEYLKEDSRRSYRKMHYEEALIDVIVDAPADDFDERAKDFLQSFLYCALRIAEANPWRNTGKLTQTFQDLIRFSKEHYEQYRDLYVEEARADAYASSLLNFANLKGMYRPAAWLIHNTTGKYLTDMFVNRDDVLREYFNYLPADLRRDLETYECRPSELSFHISGYTAEPASEPDPQNRRASDADAEDRYAGDADAKDRYAGDADAKDRFAGDADTEKRFAGDADTEKRFAGDADAEDNDENEDTEDLLLYDEDADDPSSGKKPPKETWFMMKERKKKEEKQRIRAQFAEKEEFLAQYLKFFNYRYVTFSDESAWVVLDEDRPLFDVIDNLETIIKGMIQLFAASKNLSKIRDDDAYFTAMALLRQANKRCRSLAGGKKNV